MKTRFRAEADDWRPGGQQITAAQTLTAVQRCLEEEGPIIVEHRFYRGQKRCQDRMALELL